ncbi:hypothetical protein PoB_002732500 [Plakobranchus ocellatus]|uniref:Uncharacterized protein n=1 Tax=Plakobranchus ocellatus TaxID=259542 RepID=A0AAV3ZY72_9GAST|nr:hypothetical protein PoB_002732500 [Plakobranchus ocellatus]
MRESSRTAQWKPGHPAKRSPLVPSKVRQVQVAAEVVSAPQVYGYSLPTSPRADKSSGVVSSQVLLPAVARWGRCWPRWRLQFTSSGCYRIEKGVMMVDLMDLLLTVSATANSQLSALWFTLFQCNFCAL